jgi:hypothetical protein
MQWAGLRRACPWRTGLLMCSLPAMALALFIAWFRWELSPPEGYYLMAYWESSKTAKNPENTTQIQWLYKAAPGRKSEPVIRQDVDSEGSGFLPIELSSSARQRGWIQLEKTPIEWVNSSELAGLLQEDFYDNRSFRQVIAEPLFYVYIIPFVVLYVAIMMRQELVTEWRRLYEELYEDEFAFDSNALWSQLRSKIKVWIYRRIASAKARLSRVNSSPKAQPHHGASANTFRTEIGDTLRSEKQSLSAVSPARPQRHLIFPGAAAVRNGTAQSKPWDESQWID